MRDLINQVIDKLAHEKGGWVSVTSGEVKDRLTDVLRLQAHEASAATVSEQR
jgi:hypothetical protein